MNRNNGQILNARAARLARKSVAVCVMMAFGTHVAWALPTGGVVSAGSTSIASAPGSMTINQTSQNAAINWQGFSIGQGEAVRFVQPNAASVALNRVLGPDASSILGSLSANGKVFLVNPNGILFGQGAQVNVGGLVASTLNITDADFMAGRYNFTGTGTGSVVNQGSINADGGYVALLGANVSNEGTISARLGTVVLAAGKAMTLDVAGDGLLNLTINEGAVNALVQNGGMIRADGGNVLLSAQAVGSLLNTVVNNTGVIQAQTIDTRSGTIKLLGDMQTGTVNVGGTLDASAPNGGNGGFIETSAAHVYVANDARVTTAALASGVSGTWLIDPVDFTIAAAGGNITGATLSANLVAGSVTITNAAGAGNGDIFVNDAVTWNAATTLTLNASRDVIANSAMTVDNGHIRINAPRNVTFNSAVTLTNATMVVCCGQDITTNVGSALTVANVGSILLSAGRDIFINGTMTATNGNMEMCAGHDVNVLGAMTMNGGTAVAGASLAGSPFFVPLGLTFVAGNAATGPGLAGGGGSVNITPVITINTAPAQVTYNPVSYSAPVTVFTGRFSAPTALTVKRLVFPEVADKASDGTTTATLTSLFKADANGLRPANISLAGTGTANFLSTTVGLNQPVDFSGFTLAGPNAADFALPINCCTQLGRTSGNMTPIVPLAAVAPLLTPQQVLVAALPRFLMQPDEIPDHVLEGLNLGITQQTEPQVNFVQVAPPQPPVVAPRAVEPPPPPPPFVVPPRPRRQDRN